MYAEYHAQIDDFERVEREIAQIIVDGPDKFLGREGRVPGGICAAARPDLCDNDEIVG